MASQLVFVVCALVAVAYAVPKQPRDLLDEALEQLDQLDSIVKGEILAAHNDLSNLNTEFNANAANVADAGVISIQEEQEAIESQLTTIKDLAHSAGKDVSSCTDTREEVLERLPAEYTEQLNDCIAQVIAQASSVASDARYLVDVNINKVHNIQQQLRRCQGEILCISPLITEIELNKVRLPQNIKAEVLATESLLTTLRISVQSCSNSHVSEYTAEASTILGDITDCVDRILG